jgi:hypothetical protein
LGDLGCPASFTEHVFEHVITCIGISLFLWLCENSMVNKNEGGVTYVKVSSLSIRGQSLAYVIKMLLRFKKSHVCNTVPLPLLQADKSPVKVNLVSFSNDLEAKANRLVSSDSSIKCCSSCGCQMSTHCLANC